MAAEYFNREARERALPFHAEAAAAEDPYPAVPQPVAALLAGDGIDVSEFEPRPAKPGEAESAKRVITIGCDPAKLAISRPIERWDDVPMVSEDLKGAAEAIRRHVAELVDDLASRR